MPSERIVVKFPSDVFKIKDILEQDIFKINGVMVDELSTIHCFAPGLTYKEYLNIDQTFAFVCSGVVANALKTLKLNQELSFDSPNAIFYVNKNFGQLSDEVALTALMIASIEKTAVITDAINFESEVTAGIEKSLTNLIDEISIGIDLKQLVEKCAEIIGTMNISVAVQNIALEKCMADANFCCGIDHVLSTTAEKYTGQLISAEQFSSSMNASIAYFRRLRDIDALTFADIDNWTMSTFDMVEI